jgi:hypothetical protein
LEEDVVAEDIKWWRGFVLAPVERLIRKSGVRPMDGWATVAILVVTWIPPSHMETKYLYHNGRKSSAR